MEVSVLTKVETPKSFWELIPRNLPENIAWRQNLQILLANDKEAQKTILELCYQYLPIMFDCFLWTYNPKNRPGKRNVPFILRPAQIEVVNEVIEAIREGHDILIDKSREEGATELVSKIFASEFLLVPQTSLLVGSRKEEYVDASCSLVGNRVVGSSKCIFHKILYTFATCPLWMRPSLIKTHMHLENLDNGSIIDGEATNPSFGAGDRRTAVMLDEFGRVEPGLAQDIRDSIADVTNCVIYNSTHFYGAGHPFAKLRRSGKVKVVILPWFSNPSKNEGLYKSPKEGEVEFYDDYYMKKYPKVFENYGN